MIKVALVRGRFLNNFEGQNYLFDKKKIFLVGISSMAPLNKDYPFSVIKLLSLSDLQNISLFNRPVKYLANRLFGDSQILWGLERLACHFDIFHTADPHYYYSYQLAKLRSQNKIKKLVATSWETITFNNESVNRKKEIKKFTQKYVDLFITYTEKAKKCLMREGVAEKKIKVVRLGVNLNHFKPLWLKSKRQKKDLKQKTITILFVGRLVWEKGLEDLQKAFKEIDGQKIKLKVVKDGTVDYKKMPQIYQKADLLVMPSKTTRIWEEQYGMVLVEAMASGLPIVAYNSGVMAEIMGDAGILVKEGDIKGLTQSIKRLIKDQDLRYKLGRISRERAERYFDSQKTAKEIEKIYRELLIVDC